MIEPLIESILMNEQTIIIIRTKRRQEEKEEKKEEKGKEGKYIAER